MLAKKTKIKYKASEIFLDEGVTFFQAQRLVSGVAWSALKLWMSLMCFHAERPELLHTRVHDQDCRAGFNVYSRLWACEPLPKKTVKHKLSLNRAKCRKGWVILIYVAMLMLKDMVLWRHPQARSSTCKIFFFFPIYFVFPSPPSLTVSYILADASWGSEVGGEDLLSFHTFVLIVAIQIIS